MRVLTITDAWHPQINGVVRVYDALAQVMARRGDTMVFITPESFRTLPMPGYHEIRLALVTPGMLARPLAEAAADHVHIATEGPLGFAARRLCLRQGRPFTTSFHTHYPDYVAARLPVPRAATFAALRWFHNAGRGNMVATSSLRDQLAARGFERLMICPLGVDQAVFNPRPVLASNLPRPHFLYAGRVAVEKNIETFLKLDLPGSKLVAGDGPSLEALKAKFPAAHFLGRQSSDDLAVQFSSADALVFPSRTDTFGLVMAEALACGLPVAAFPVDGPRDVIGQSGAGVMAEDLRAAALAALSVDRAVARARGAQFTWEAATDVFIANCAKSSG